MTTKEAVQAVLFEMASERRCMPSRILDEAKVNHLVKKDISDRVQALLKKG